MSKKVEKVDFDDALTATGFGAFNVSLLLLCSSMICAMSFEMFSIGYLVVGSACELLTTSAEQGLVAAMPILGTIFSAHIWGYLADTRGRKYALILSLVVSLTMSTLSTLSPNWIVFALMKLCSSSAVAGTFAITMTLLSEFSPADRRSTLLILAASCYLLSPGIMAVIALPVLPLTFSYPINFLNIHFNSWRLLGLIFALPSVISIIGMCLCPESPKFLASVGKDEEALKILRLMFRWNTGRTEEEFEVESFNESELRTEATKGLWSSLKAQTIPLLKPPLLINTVKLSCIIVAVYVGTTPYIMWIPSMADGFTRAMADDRRLTFCEMITGNNTENVAQESSCVLDSTAMLVVFLTYTLYAVLNVVMTAVVKVVPRKIVTIVIQLITGISGLTINFVRGWQASAVLMMALLAPLLLAGVITTFSVNMFPTHLRAMSVSLTLMVGRVSAVGGIQLLNYLLVANCPSSFYIFSAIAFAGAISACFLPSEKKTNEE